MKDRNVGTPDENVDYKEMYLTMVRASERAMQILIDAQRTCEEKYIQAGVSNILKLIEKAAK